MNAQTNRFLRFTSCIVILLVLSFTVISATTTYAKGMVRSSSDSYNSTTNTDTKDETRASKSSVSTQRTSEPRVTQPEVKRDNAYTPPPSANYGRQNTNQADTGPRYSKPRYETGQNNTYTPQPNNGVNRNNSKDVRINTDNPYNYRQPGNTNNNQRTNDTNNRNNWTKPSDNTTNNRLNDTTNGIRTKSDNPYGYQKPDGINTRDSKPTIDRNNNDSGSNNRFGSERNPSNVKDIRTKDDISRNQTNNRQYNSRDLPSTRNVDKSFRLPNDPRKDYRKEYEDIGNIWHQRAERRESHPENRRHGLNINIIINNPIFSGYCYDYTPLYSYPSVYCYYYDYFPPYIYGDRIIYLEPYAHRVRYNELTIFLNNPDNYYASDPARRALNIALGDIEQAWEQKDIDRFMMYVRPKSSVAIFNKGDYSYSLDWLDYSNMTRDAMNSIDTQSFQFEKLTRRQNTGEITAYGRHKFYDWDGSLDTVYVRYTFERVSGEWYITEAETSNYKNW